MNGSSPRREINHSSFSTNATTVTMKNPIICMLILLACSLLRNGSNLLRSPSNSIRSAAQAKTTPTTNRTIQAVLPASERRANDNDNDKDTVATTTQDTTKDEEKDEDNRPFLILHVGPPKTGSTTIQAGLVENVERLARDDNWYYLGKVPSGTVPDYDHDHDHHTLYKLPEMFSEAFREDLANHADLGHNVILAAEQLAENYTDWDIKTNLFDKIFLHREPERLEEKANGNRDRDASNSIHQNKSDTSISGSEKKNSVEVETYDDPAIASSNSTSNNEEPFFRFNVKVVVTYRHFFEWLASMHYQAFKNHKGSHVQIVDFVETYLDRLVQYDPEDTKHKITTKTETETEATISSSTSSSIYTTPSFDSIHGSPQSIRKRSETQTSHGSVFTYLKFSSLPELNERVEIFDMHQQPRVQQQQQQKQSEDDMFASFVCQIIPDASETCRHLTEDAIPILHRNDHSMVGVNSISRTDVHEILRRAQTKYGIRYPGKPGSERKGVTTKINECFRQEQQSQEYKKCIGAELSQRLKTASWNALLQMALLTKSHRLSRKQRRDEDYCASLFRSVNPTNHLLLTSACQSEDENEDNSWMAPTKAAHDAAFDSYVAKEKYCQIDLDKVFADQDFVRLLVD
jgi:hypothetical protein